jgi:hypothetical protein
MGTSPFDPQRTLRPNVTLVVAKLAARWHSEATLDTIVISVGRLTTIPPTKG